ncbi:MAG: hypothetical protein IPK82_27810 [Polyangiaceae bacterium]|nr:hypothetical protein [Polyangiaceae bacterium]
MKACGDTKPPVKCVHYWSVSTQWEVHASDTLGVRWMGSSTHGVRMGSHVETSTMLAGDLTMTIERVGRRGQGSYGTQNPGDTLDLS